MKKLDLFLIGTLFFISSCKEDELYQPEPLPICLMEKSSEEPIVFLPFLNIHPIFLEIHSGWQHSGNHYSSFKLSIVQNNINSELLVSSAPTNLHSLKCQRRLTASQYLDLINWLNTSSVCKSISYHSNSCEASMIAPASVYAVDPALGPMTIGLTPYALGNESSFCNQYEISELYNLIAKFYENLDYKNECIIP